MGEQMLSHRIAQRADLDAIVAIYNSTVASRRVTADTEPVTVESRLRWFEDHAPARHPLWVVEISGEVAAWLSFSKFYARPAYDRTAELSIYVADGRRRQGVGAYLLGQALAEAPGLGLDNLLGLIFGHNTESLALFNRFGFQRWGELPRVTVLDGVERDVVIVGRRV